VMIVTCVRASQMAPVQTLKAKVSKAYSKGHGAVLVASTERSAVV